MYIKYSDIPNWLHNSELYLFYKNNIDNEYDDFLIEIDEYYPPSTDEINNLSDFIKLFYIYDRWGLEYNINFWEYIYKNPNNVLEFLYSIKNQYTQAKLLLDDFFKSKLKFRISIYKTYDVDYNNNHMKQTPSIIWKRIVFIIEYNTVMYKFEDYILINNILIFKNELLNILDRNMNDIIETYDNSEVGLICEQNFKHNNISFFLTTQTDSDEENIILEFEMYFSNELKLSIILTDENKNLIVESIKNIKL